MKKGQAAMEFLMTYGWAILVVLAAIGALAYFGVLSPSKHLPSSCIFQQGIACVDFTVDSTSVNLYLQNGYAQDLQIYNVTIGNCDVNVLDQRVPDIDEVLVQMTGCDNGISGDKFKEEVVITYSFVGSPLTKTNIGNVIAQIS